MPAPFDQHLETGNKALARFENSEALAAFEAALAVAAGAPHERALALDGAAVAHHELGETDRALELLDQAIELCMPQADTDKRSAQTLARVWYDKGGILAEVGRAEAAVTVLGTLIGRFADEASADIRRDDDDLRLRPTIVRAMTLKATGLRKLDRKREAIACYNDMIRRFESIDDDWVTESIAGAMLGRGRTLGDLGREDEEIAAYDALVARYGEIRLLGLSHTVLDALENKLLCYRDQEDSEGVVEVCDDIMRRYEFDAGDGIAERVARTMIRKAVALNKLGRTAGEISCYDKVVVTYGAWPEAELREHAAKALMFKAVTLNDADQTNAEMECYEEILRRYAEDADERVRAVAADALVHKGLSLGAIADDAAEDTGVRETEAEIACYDRVIARYGQEKHIGLQQAVAEALLHKGETLAESGHSSAAALCFDAVIDGYAGIEDEVLKEIVADARELRGGR